MVPFVRYQYESFMGTYDRVFRTMIVLRSLKLSKKIKITCMIINMMLCYVV